MSQNDKKRLRLSTDATRQNSHVFAPDGTPLRGITRIFTTINNTATIPTVTFEAEVEPLSLEEASELLKRDDERDANAASQAPMSPTDQSLRAFRIIAETLETLPPPNRQRALDAINTCYNQKL